MNNVVLIRKYHAGDELQCQHIIHEATMSTVGTAFVNGLTREITFQLMVLCSAVMFIFLGFPFYFCVCSVPGVLFLMYSFIWCAHKLKAMENSQELCNIPRVYMSDGATCFWVAEAYEPHFMTRDPSLQKYTVLSEKDMRATHTDLSSLRKRIVGIVAVARSLTSPDTARLKRLAVRPKYRCKGIASTLVDQAVSFCKEKKYNTVTLRTTECHEPARKLYVKYGFQLKEMYHKKIIGSFVMLLYYELYYNLNENRPPVASP